MTKFSFLHISDLHFSEEDFDQSLVVKAFFDDLAKLASNIETSPSFVAFSGDLVRKGDNKGDFIAVYDKFIKRTIEILNLDTSRFFITPGNHDIQKSKVKDRFEFGLDKTLVTADDINELIEKYDSDYQDDVKARFENYRNFLIEVGLRDTSASQSNIFTTHTLNIDSQKIGIVCLNSSLRATGKPENYDYGKLMMGVRQIDSALPAIADCDLKIANFHHSVEWLTEIERQDVKRKLQENFDLILYGHSHNTASESTQIPASRFVVSNAGALYEKTKRYVGYSIIEVSQDRFRVSIRNYFKERGCFDKGVNLFPDGTFLIKRHKTRSRVKSLIKDQVISRKYPSEETNREINLLAAKSTEQLFDMLESFKQLPSEEIGQRASAVVSLLIARKADFFRGYDFSNLCLRNADFSGANLTGAVFRDTDLAGAYFSDVILDNAIFEGVNLEQTQFLEIGSFRSVEISPNRGIISAGSSGVLVHWDSKAVLKGHRSTVLDLKISNCDKYLATSHENGMIFIWQPSESDEPIISPLRKYRTPVYAIDWNPIDAGQIVSSGQLGSIIVWNWKHRVEKIEYRNHSREVLTLDWNKNGKWLLTAGIDKKILVWDTKEWVAVSTANIHRDYVRVVRWRDYDYFASGGDDGKLCIWKWDGDRSNLLSRLNMKSPILSISWHPNQNIIACGLRDDSVVFWNLSDINKIRSKDIKRIKLHVGRVWDLQWSADGNRLVSVGNEGSVVVWNDIYDLEKKRLRDTKSIISSAQQLQLRFCCHGLQLKNLINASPAGYQVHKHKDRDWEVEDSSLEDWLISKGAIAY
jgi:WD40 repeat protein